MNTAIALAYASTASALLPIGIYLWKQPRAYGFLRYLFILCVASFLFDLAAYGVAFQNGSPFLLGNIFSLVNVVLLCKIYQLMWEYMTKLKIPTWIGCVILGAIFLWDSVVYEPISGPQSVVTSAEAILFSLYSVLFYIGMIRHLPHRRVEIYSPMWLNLGVLLYYAFSFWIFVISNQLFSSHPELGASLWQYHNENNMMKNLLFAVAIFTAENSSKSEHKINPHYRH